MIQTDLQDVILFPHGNLLSQLKLVQKEILDIYNDSNIIPLFCECAVISSGSYNANNMKNMFQSKNEKAFLSCIKFCKGLFYCLFEHSLIFQLSSDELENFTSFDLLPKKNAFCFAKIENDEVDLQKIAELNKKLKIEQKLRVFQLADGKILGDFKNMKKLEISTYEKIWVKLA